MKNIDTVTDTKTLINDYLKLVYSISKSYASKLNIDEGELIGYGYEGLFMAATKFREDRGETFVAYATSCISGYILNAISNLKGFSSLNIYQEFLKNKRKFYNGKSVSLDITKDSFLENLKVIEESNDMTKLQKKNAFTMLSLLMNDTYDKHIDELVTRDFDSTFSVVYYHQLQDNLKQVIMQLNEKEQEILKYRYGLEEYPLYSLSQLSEIFHMSQEGIRQVEKRSLKKLKRIIKKEGLVALEFFDQNEEYHYRVPNTTNYQKCKISF